MGQNSVHAAIKTVSKVLLSLWYLVLVPSLFPYVWFAACPPQLVALNTSDWLTVSHFSCCFQS